MSNSNQEFHEDMAKHDENVLKSLSHIKCSCGKQGDLVYACQICRPKMKDGPQKCNPEDFGWQKCPVCNGHGILFPHGLTANTTLRCDTCNGQKIINKITGKPPIL